MEKYRFRGFEKKWENASLENAVGYITSQIKQCNLKNDGIYPVYSTKGIISFEKNFQTNVDAIGLSKDGTIGNPIKLPKNSNVVGTSIILIPKNNFNRDFIYYLLCNNFDFGEKGGVIKHIYFSVYCKNKIKVPNIREQQKIADFLSTIDDLETILKNQLEQIELMKQYYLDKLFPKKDSNVPEIRFKRFSGEWEGKKLNDIFEIKNGSTPSKQNLSFWTNGSIPWFRMDDIRKNGNILNDSLQHISTFAINEKRLMPSDSFIVATTATIGEYAFIQKKSYWMNQQFTGLKIKNCSKHDVEFLFCQLEKLKEFCKKNTHGSIFQAVDMEKFKTFVFKHPEFNEQQKIADFLFNINEQKNLIKNQIDLILILKQFYLRGLFF